MIEHRVPTPAGELHAVDLGDPTAPSVLLVHPINLSSPAWYAVAEALAPQWHVIALDLRGHGRSHANGPFGVDAWRADCLAVLDHLGVESFHVAGGSLGGTISATLAAYHPDRVRSLMTFGSAARSGVQRDTVRRMLDELGVAGMFRKAFTEFTFGPATSTEIVEYALTIANPNSEPVVRAVWEATQGTDVREAVSAVRCPASVLTGEFDTTCPPERGRELAELTGASFELMEGLGHIPMLEDPERVVDAWRRHQARIADGLVGER